MAVGRPDRVPDSSSPSATASTSRRATASPTRPSAAATARPPTPLRCTRRTASPRRRCCGPRRPDTAYSDARTRIITEGADPAERDRRGQGDRRRRARAHRRRRGRRLRAPAGERPGGEHAGHALLSRPGEPALTAGRGGVPRPLVGRAAAVAGRRLAGHQNNNLWFWVFVGPFVLGMAVFVIAPDRLEPGAQPVRGAQHGLADRVRRLAQLPGDARATRRSAQSLVTFVAFAAFIVPLTFACSLGLALLVNQVRRRQGVLPVGVLPAGGVQLRRGLDDLEDVDLQRRALRARQHGAAGVRHRGPPVALAAATRRCTGWSSCRSGCGCRSASTCCCSSPGCSASRRCSTKRRRSTGRRGAGRRSATSRSRSCGRRRPP